MRSRDANGNFSATAAATLRVVATTPTIHATASTFADGAALRLDLRATTPDGSPIARWRFDWGDGQTSDFAEFSDALTAAHYYAPTEADAVYEASLTVFGAGFEFSCALTSHSVPGRGAASQTAQETALSDVASKSCVAETDVDVAAQTTLSDVASSSCVAEALCDIETQNAFESAIAATFGTSSDAASRSRESWSDSNVAPASNATRFLGDLPKITTRRVDVNALNDGETRRGFERRESGVFTASSAFAALLEEFAELDFFIDEDDFDALASRRVRR